MFYDNREHHHHRGPEAHPHFRFGRFGRRDMPPRRMLSSEDLQLLLLLLLKEQPRHGYELIKTLEERTQGFYAPSPGMIYPSLTFLEEAGLASVTTEGAKKRYELTPEGSAHLANHAAQAEAILEHLTQTGARMSDAFDFVQGERGPRGPGGDPMHDLRHRLRGFMRGHHQRGPRDAEKVRAVFEAALARLTREPGEHAPDPEALADAIAHRRSLGLARLKSDPVERALIEKMLAAANWAPSHGDTEPWRFKVFTGEGRHVLAALYAQAMGPDASAEAQEGARKRAFAAPVWIAIGMVPKLKEDGSLEMTEDEELMAVACAVQNLHLMASELGLAGMWHSKGLSIDPVVAEGLGWTAPNRLLGFFFCGWPAIDWPQGERGPIEDKVKWIDQ